MHIAVHMIKHPAATNCTQPTARNCTQTDASPPPAAGHDVTLFTRGKKPVTEKILDDTEEGYKNFAASIKHMKGDRMVSRCGSFDTYDIILSRCMFMPVRLPAVAWQSLLFEPIWRSRALFCACQLNVPVNLLLVSSFNAQSLPISHLMR